MPTYDPIADTDIEPEKPVTTSLMTRMRDNPIAIVMRDGNVNRVKPPDVTVLSGSGNFTVPANVHRVRVTAIGGGGGGGGDGGDGGAGGNTTFGSITANGGAGGAGTPVQPDGHRSANGGATISTTRSYGNGGEIVIGVIDTTPGALIAYSVGAAGAAGASGGGGGSPGSSGGVGTIIVEG